jgi:hypothetical protein
MKFRSVRFISRTDGRLGEVEVQSATGQSALPDLQRLLHTMGLCVVEARARVHQGELFERVSLTEGDGRPLAEERYFEVQDSLLGHFAEPASSKVRETMGRASSEACAS